MNLKKFGINEQCSNDDGGPGADGEGDAEEDRVQRPELE